MVQLNSILIFEKNQNILDLIISTLECYGFSNYKFALNLDELNHLLKSDTFDLIICEDGQSKKELVVNTQQVQIYSFAAPEVIDGVTNILDSVSSMNNESELISSSVVKFVPVSIQLLKKLNTMPAEVYLKMSENKMLKILTAGDLFSEKDFLNFKGKGIPHLYLRSLDFLNSCHQIEKDIQTILEDKRLDKNDKFLLVHDNILSVAESYDLSDELIELSKKTIESFISTSLSEKDLYNTIAHLLDYPTTYLCKQAVLTSHLSCGLASLMDWKSELTFYKLTLAAFYANARLPQFEIDSVQKAQILNHPTVLKLNHAEVIYQQHPIESSQVIKKFKVIPPDVDRIILEHHEHPEGTGFPRGLFHPNISPFGAILIIASELADLLIENKEKGSLPDFTVFAKRLGELGYYKGHFRKIVDLVPVL